MISLHEISTVLQKMAVMSNYIVQLNQLLPQVVRLFEKLDLLNQDLTVDQDRMTAKLRSVEILGEILRTHVYHTPSEPTVDDFSRH